MRHLQRYLRQDAGAWHREDESPFKTLNVMLPLAPQR